MPNRVFEVHTIETVNRVYLIEFNSDLGTRILKDEAEELVRNGEIHKFTEVDAHISSCEAIREVTT